MVKKIIKWAKEETLKILPAVIYFFVIINLFKLTFGWMLLDRGIELVTFARSIIAAIIIGKVMFITNNMPFFNMFSQRPLIYNTVWKTTLYFIIAFIIRTLEHLIPFLLKYKDLGVAYDHMISEVWWAKFWTVQVWLFVLLFIFVIFQELVKGIGKENLRKIFFKKQS